MTDRGMQVHLLIIISRAFLEACQQLALRRPMFNKIPLLQLKKIKVYILIDIFLICLEHFIYCRLKNLNDYNH